MDVCYREVCKLEILLYIILTVEIQIVLQCYFNESCPQNSHLPTCLHYDKLVFFPDSPNYYFSVCIESVTHLCYCLLELVLKQEQEEYRREGIEWKNIDFFNNQIICDLVEQSHKGVLAIMDEACLNVGKVTDEVLCTPYHSINRYFILSEIPVQYFLVR